MTLKKGFDQWPTMRLRASMSGHSAAELWSSILWAYSIWKTRPSTRRDSQDDTIHPHPHQRGETPHYSYPCITETESFTVPVKVTGEVVNSAAALGYNHAVLLPSYHYMRTFQQPQPPNSFLAFLSMVPEPSFFLGFLNPQNKEG